MSTNNNQSFESRNTQVQDLSLHDSQKKRKKKENDLGDEIRGSNKVEMTFGQQPGWMRAQNEKRVLMRPYNPATESAVTKYLHH